MIEYKPVSDIDQINVLQNKFSNYNDFVYQYEEETIHLLKEYFVRPDSLYLIATEVDDFAGFVSCDSDWWEPDHFFLREIYVEPAYQGKSIGKTLVRYCIDHARSHGATALVTQTAYANIPMQKLCEGAGFEQYENPQWNEGVTYKLLLKPL